MKDVERSAPTWVDHVLRSLALMVGIAILGLSIATPPEEATRLGPDELLHLVSYLVFTFVARLAIVARPGRRAAPPGSGRVVAAVVALVGASIEIVQMLVDRDPSALDALANATGAALALWLWSLVLRSGERRS